MTNSSCSFPFQSQILPLIYGLELCVALPGNLLVLWMLVRRERRNWHTGVVFSCNLAISDILYVLTFPLLIIYYSKEKKNRKWTFSEPVCKIERFLFACNLYVSIYFIMCISFNRYLAIVYPFFTRNTVRPKHAKITSLLVWITAAILSSPILKFAGVEDHRCKSFIDIVADKKHIYRPLIAVMGCLIPFLVTFASYFAMIWAVLKNTNITTLEKKKVAMIVASVCIIYVMSFVPYHILQIWHFYLKEIIERKSCAVQTAYRISKALAGVNMCLHPILFMAVSDSDRTLCCRRSSNE